MRESICSCTYSGYIADSYKEEIFNGIEVYSFDMAVKITLSSKVFNTTIKVLAVMDIHKAIVSNYIISENLGKRLEISGMEIPNLNNYGSVLIIQRIDLDDKVINKTDEEKEARNKIDLKDTEKLY